MTTCPPDQKLCALAEAKFAALEKLWDAKHAALEAAITAFNAVMADRLDKVNHLQKQINEDRMTYISRRETVLLNLIISFLVVFVAAALTYELSK
jgi:hypothetical protein